MWTPKLEIIENSLETARDSYVLSGIQGGVSVRRPFLSAGIFVAVANLAIILGFADILYLSELITLSAIGFSAIVGGLTLAQLHIISRDLRGTKMSEAVWGPFRHLNRKRREIARAIHQVQAGERP